MKAKSRKMTKLYWSRLERGSRERALTYVFPIHPAAVRMMLDEKPDLSSVWWEVVFKKVRIPADNTNYKTIVNHTYLC